MDMKRLVMTVVAAGAALTAAAMPTKAELRKAQEMVSDVTEADVKALKSGAKKPAEVAAKHMELAAQAGSEAEKYLLLQGAFKLYAKAGDYEGAANALGTMNREIADMNPEVIVEIYNRAIFSSMKEKAPKLHAIKEAARRQVTYRKQLAKAEAAVKANPKDAVAQKKLGECHAELGNWPKALDAFALADGTLAKTAKAEKDGSAAPQVSGDFWWDYESGDEMSTYKLHAAELYRAALASDSFKGLARTRTEQRVKECEAVSADLPPVVAAPTTVMSGKAPTLRCKMINGRPAPLKFELAKDVDLELEGCPSGKFTMGYAAGMWNDDGKAAPKHEVTITRPFWIGKFQVTRGQAKSLDVKPNDCHLEVQSAFDGKGGDTCSAVMTFDNINAFCRKLTEKFAAKIPTGYVFRLASNAEWEYASKAGDYSEKNPAMLYSGHKESPYILTRHDKLALLKKKNIEWKDSPVVLPAFPVGLKRPNGWGLFDMLGNHPEVTMDQIPKNAPDVVNYGQGKELGIIRAITHARQEKDPLMYYETDWNLLVRGRWDNYLLMEALPANRIQYAGGFGYTFRVCLGPDLIAEKKAKGNSDADAKKTEVAGPVVCYPCEDFGGVLLSSKYEIVEYTGKMRYVRHKDGLFNCERPNRSAGDGFAFEVGAKEKEAGFTLALPEPVTLAGLLVVNRAETCQERQVPLCVWASEDRVKWERIFIDESVRDEYRIDLSNKNIICKYLRFGRLPGVNSEPFHLARTLVYTKPSAAAKKANEPQMTAQPEKKGIQTLPPVKPSGTRPADKKFNLAKGIDVEMVACPAGTFKMSNAPGGPNGDGTHEVKLTRTYWIASSCVTRAMYKAFEADYDKDEKKDGEKKLDDLVTGYARAEAFANWLNKRFQSKLPRGYVFRLPSEAEWEYAMNTGAVARSWDFEGTLDTVRAVSGKAYAWKFDVSVMDYAAKESDPLRICSQNPAWVCRQNVKKRFLLRMDGQGCFRMAVGPDLVAEKKAKK